jgi:protein tyrosine phosphatase
MLLNKVLLKDLPKSVPDYININYVDGNVIAECQWAEKIIKIKFTHVESFRVSLEGLLLKMHASLEFTEDCFVYCGDKLDLYTWVNDQTYGYLDNFAFHKTMLVAEDQIIELIHAGDMEIITDDI